MPTYSTTISIEARLQVLLETHLFSKLDDLEILTQVAQTMDEAALPAERRILDPGQPVEQLYVVVSGAVTLQAAQTTLAKLSRGACFGQLQSTEPSPHGISVTTLTPTQLLMLTPLSILQGSHLNPEQKAQCLRLFN